MATPPTPPSIPPPYTINKPESTYKASLQLIRFANQSGTLLLLFPSLWALVLASPGNPDPTLILIFCMGAFLMRSAGVIFNDLADRSIDKKVQRTQQRPLARGALSSSQALGLAFMIVVMAFGLVLLLNPLSIALSPIALLLAAIYPFAKRYIHIPQLVLGIAFGWGAVMAWAAVRNRLDISAWLLFLATVCWAIAYDTIYALQDRQDDMKIGVKSSAILFGQYVWLGVAISSAFTIVCLGLAGWIHSLHSIYYLGLTGICVFLGQQVWQLRKERSRSTYFSMFKQHVWVGLAVLTMLWVGKL